MNEVEKIIKNVRNFTNNIADDVWPNGWDMECEHCGKIIHLTTEECGYCLGHGWPRCCGYSMRGIESKEEQ